MKKKLFNSMFMLILFLMSTVLVSSCGSDDDGIQVEKITQSEIVGTWEITSVSGTSTWNWIATGKTLTFNTDGSCTTGFSMENSYKIENGIIHTYYKSTSEPMLIYTVVSKDGNIYTVKVQGTLDESNLSVMIKMKKQ